MKRLRNHGEDYYNSNLAHHTVIEYLRDSRHPVSVPRKILHVDNGYSNLPFRSNRGTEFLSGGVQSQSI